jgi:D-alanyl-D-alanine carboxypeptidase
MLSAFSLLILRESIYVLACNSTKHRLGILKQENRMKKKLIPLMKWAAVLTVVVATAPLSAVYAAIVIDADTGEVIHSKTGEPIIHPTSLTGLGNLSGSP